MLAGWLAAHSMCSQLICISNSKTRFDTSWSLEVLAEHTRKSGNRPKKVIQSPGGLLNKVLYGEAPPGGSNPYPLIY